jgi:uncharacterized membrane protein
MKHRLELFSDAVFAIIITVMVLDLHAPGGTGWRAWKPLLPTLLAYVVAFLFLLIVWGHHQHLFSRFREVTKGMYWANGCCLLATSLTPLALLNFTNHPKDPTALVIYLVLLVLSFGFQSLTRWLADPVHRDDPGWAAWMKKRNRTALIGNATIVAVIGIAFVSIPAAIVMLLLVLGYVISTV